MPEALSDGCRVSAAGAAFVETHDLGSEITAHDFRALNRADAVQVNSGAWCARVGRISIQCPSPACDWKLNVQLNDGLLADVSQTGECHTAALTARWREESRQEVAADQSRRTKAIAKAREAGQPFTE